jgi:hypothetical protein
MNADQTALLREIRDLLREQTALAQGMRDMNLRSIERIQASCEQSEQLMAGSERLQSKSERACSERPFSSSNLVLYGAAIVLALALFAQLRALL